MELKYFAAVLINRTMQVLKIYLRVIYLNYMLVFQLVIKLVHCLYLAALGIPFQPLPDYEEGADQVCIIFFMFILAEKF